MGKWRDGGSINGVEIRGVRMGGGLDGGMQKWLTQMVGDRVRD